MRCPYCGHTKDRVVDSRESREAQHIRRRRECLECGRRFTSYERIEEIPYMVIKKNGSRELFDRAKVMSGLMKACEKRPVSPMALERVVNRVEMMVQENPDREVHSVEIGKLLLSELKDLDKVAYLRFASVYLEFEDVAEFLREVNILITRKT